MVKESIVAKSYARSIYQLAKETNISIAKELTELSEVINSSNDFETALFLNVFTPEEKMSVFNTVIEKMNVSSLLKNTVNLLIQEGRIGIFPLIFKEVVVFDDYDKGFLRGNIEGWSENPPSEEFNRRLHDFLKKKLNREVRLDYKRIEKLTAGYRVMIDDFQLDASLDYQLDRLKNTIFDLSKT